MSRRSKETLAVQLFPFLAVLVCTMGALIFLLLVTTREIRQRVVAFAAFQEAELQEAENQKKALVIEEPEPAVPPVAPAVQIPVEIEEPVTPAVDGYELALAERERELERMRAQWRLRVSELEKELEQRRTAITQRQTRLDGTLESSALLESEIKKLEEQLGLLAGESAAAMLNKDEAERLTIEQQIAELKKRLRAAQVADATDDNDKFQVVPFDPQTGTSRRPIFLECSAAGIRFLPENILINARDMEGFTTRANPLAAGTGALVNYWSAWNQKQRNPRSEPEPYIMLIVRPDGIYSYYVAMRMLEPIRTSHGYELIDESTALKLPEVDQGAKTACQTAVDRLLEQRESIALSAVNSGAGGSVFGGTPGRRAGGLGQGFGPDGSNPSDGSTPRRATGGGFTMDDVTGGDSEVGSRSWERVENFQGRPRTKRRGGNPLSPLEETPEGYSASNQYGRNPGQGTAQQPKHTADGETVQARRPDQQPGENGQGSSEGSQPADGTTGPASTSQAYGTDNLEPDMPIGQRPGRKPGRSSSSSAEGEDGESDSGDAETTDGGSPQKQPNSRSKSQSGDPNSPSLLSDDSAAPRRFSHDPKSATRLARTGEKPNRMNSDPDKPLEPEMLAGRRWGLCEPGASIGYEREVRVDVSNDKLVIAEKHAIPIAEGETKQEVFVRFATALDAYSYEWGRPPQGFFWAPRLKFVVKPEGDARYEQINAMMTRAGMATSHEFAQSTRAVEFGRMTPKQAKQIPKTAVHPKTRGSR